MCSCVTPCCCSSLFHPPLPAHLLPHFHPALLSPPSQLPNPRLQRDWDAKGLTIKQLPPVDLTRLEFDGDDVTETLVEELGGDSNVGHCARDWGLAFAWGEGGREAEGGGWSDGTEGSVGSGGEREGGRVGSVRVQQRAYF